jgi:streptomycin 6-kinase
VNELGRLPSDLRWLRRTEDGRAWLASLPALAAACAEQWSLMLGGPFPQAFVSLPLAATRADGTNAVLKLQFPGRESEHEAEALRRWDGDGAIRLLEHDPAKHALLLERCDAARRSRTSVNRPRSTCSSSYSHGSGGGRERPSGP